MNLGIVDIINIVISIIFATLGVLMFVRYFKLKGKIIIEDQQWSTMRLLFLGFGLLAFVSIVTGTAVATVLDYVRLGATLLAVTGYMIVRDGVGEEGMISAGKLIPWDQVRAYDMEERKNVIAVYFTVESQNEKKPDEYTTKELDFAQRDKEYLGKFLEMNLGRKFTRMKKKK